MQGRGADCPCQKHPPWTSALASMGSLVGTMASHPRSMGCSPGRASSTVVSEPPRGMVMLRGRANQCLALDGLLADVRSGHSRALGARGEAGIGKTALFGYAADTAPDFQMARAEGVESEM